MKRERAIRLVGAVLLLCLLATAVLSGALAASHADCHCVYQPGCPVCLQIHSARVLVLLLALCALAFVSCTLFRAAERAALSPACAATPVSRKVRMNN